MPIPFASLSRLACRKCYPHFRRVLFVFALFSSLAYINTGFAMAPFFSKTEAVLFSPLKGTLTHKGEPAANAEITLLLRWKDEKGETFHYRANEKGEFSIPEHKSTYRDNPLSQLVILQRITVVHDGSEHLIWSLSKMNGDLFGELGRAPDDLTCELTNELETYSNDTVLGGTSCQWQ